MLSFADVVRYQPNKFPNGSKSSATAETKEESVDYGFYDGQDTEEGWDRNEESNNKVQPYDCYKGAAPQPKPQVSAGVGVVNGPTRFRGVEGELKCKSIISGSQQRNALPNRPPVDEVSSVSTDGQSPERFLLVTTRLAKYMKCIELIKESPARSNVLIIVNGEETDTSLLVALLCLSDISAGPAGESAVTVQVARRNDLNMVKGPINLIINFEMVSSLKELAARGALLSDDGNMRTLVLETSDARSAQKFVSQLFRYGLALPFELERYLA